MDKKEAIGAIRFLLDVGGSDGFTSRDEEALNLAINALSDSEPPQTNGDKIRALMTDEGIAENFFCAIYDECFDCPLRNIGHCNDIAVRMKWLKREVQSDDER